MEDDVARTPPKAQVGRRRILTLLTAGTIGAGAALILAAVFRLPFPRVRSQSDVVRLGRAVDYPLHRYTFVADCNVFVYRDRKGIRVLSAVCTHLGCVVRASESGFQCPCHGSRFDIQGEPLSGPAARPLEWYHAERALDGVLLVDLSRRVSRNRFLTV